MKSFREYFLLREGGVPELTTANFETFIKSPAAVVMYGADYCRGCQLAMPWFIEMGNQGIAVGKVDITHEEGLAEEAGLGTIPTFDVYKNGIRIQRITGSGKKAAIEKALGMTPDLPSPQM